ncbi:FkbM family methyltransferase [Bradyrhizobium sp. USDA 241]|uniref:FkbM family methyltransferase n=1 Tax=Bradyrhizobium sp. USDA 241 TaxID=3377725 RepID=UPI003C79093C
MISYSQNFEDVLLARLFQGQSNGFYIDVGAWDPTLHSVTRHFYDLGWSGVNIEPVLRQHQLFVEERPRDRNLNVAVGDTTGRLRFFECKDLTSLSTANEAQAEALRAAGHEVVNYEVPVITLDDVLATCGDRVVDFLKVDVEGFEAAVLRGVDWQRRRPRALVVEATLPSVKIEDWDRVDDIRNWDSWEPLLLASGYQLAWYDGLSRFYLRNEDEGLRRRLSLPPCVHDGFELAEVHELKRKQQMLMKEREDVLSANQRLETALNAIESDRDEKSHVVERLVGEVAELKSNRQALMNECGIILQANQRLETELRSVEADRTEKSQVVERLVRELTELKIARQALMDDRENVLKGALRLESEFRAVESDRAEMSRIVERLTADLEHSAVTSAIQRRKLAAKDQVIESIASRGLKSKALLGGFPDILVRRQHVTPVYGDYFPPEGVAQGVHVAIDTLEIVFGVSGGVETYMKMLTGALLQGGRRITLICLPDQVASLRRLFDTRVGYFVMRESRAVGLSIEVSNRLRGRSSRLTAASSLATFAHLREDIGVDILHSPVQIFSTLDFRVPSVLNLHDLQHLHFPENFTPSDIDARNRLYGLSASLADAIVVSSDFVRNDLINQMQVPAAKVFTVPVTWDPMVIAGLDTFSLQDATAHYKLPSTYAIYPAQFWPHKNHVRLVRALRILRNKRPDIDLKLVFTGYRGHSGWPAVKATIEELGLEGDVICLDHVPVGHLAALYKGAVYCIVSSIFEASSYPVIEAQVLGVPAMCSNITSLPELMRDGAGLLFDPFDVEDIAAKMLLWLDNPEDGRAHADRARSKARQEHSLENYVAGLARVYDYAAAAGKIGPESGAHNICPSPGAPEELKRFLDVEISSIYRERTE